MPIWRYRCEKCGNEVEELVLSRDGVFLPIFR